MAVSGSVDFSMNANELITSSFRVMGVIAPEAETPTAAEMNTGLESLNMLIKAWQAKSYGLWLEKTVTLFLDKTSLSYDLGPTGDHATLSSVQTAIATAGSSSDLTIDVDSITGISDGDYIGIELDDGTIQWTTVNGSPAGTTITITDALTDDVAVDNEVYTYTTKINRPLEILEDMIYVQGDSDIPIEIISRSEYMALSNKSTSGKVNQVYYDPQLTNGKLYVWPITSDATDKIIFTAKMPVNDFDALTNDPDFPQEWLRALKWNNALEMCSEFDVPDTKFQKIVNMAQITLAEALDFDNEAVSFRLTPSRRVTR